MTAHVSCCPFLLPSWVGDDAHEIDLRRQIPADRAKDRLLPEAAGSDAGAAGGTAGAEPRLHRPRGGPNTNKAVSLDTLFDVAAALDVPPYKFLLSDE